MPKFFVKNEQIDNEKVVIVGLDINHIINVLRLKVGDNITICNEESMENYNAKIEYILDNKEIWCKIEERIELSHESKVQITLFQGLPKSDKMEYIIQKNVEIGIFDITPVEMKRCIVKLDEKAKINKVGRWQKISEVAAKQSGRDIVPKINDVINIKNICNLIKNYDIVLVAYEKENENTLKKELEKIDNKEQELKIGIIIGPEGGLEESEIELLKQSGTKVITLGKRILRTETAGLVLTSIIMYELDF